jgi:hypothetical protein
MMYTIHYLHMQLLSIRLLVVAVRLLFLPAFIMQVNATRHRHRKLRLLPLASFFPFSIKG